MIREIRLGNFKAFKTCQIIARPLTIFLGPNNSGKSSILAALRLLSQTNESYDLTPSLLLKGNYGDFGTFRDVVYGNNRGRSICLGVTMDGRHVQVADSEQSSATLISLDLTFKYRPRRRHVTLNQAKMVIDGVEAVTTKYSESNDGHFIERLSGLKLPDNLRGPSSRLLRMQNFIPTSRPVSFAFQTEGTAIEKWIESKRVGSVLDKIRRAAFDLSGQFRRSEYLGPLRAPPERTYTFSGEKRQHVGLSGEHAVDVFVADISERKSSRRIRHRISQWLKETGAASDVRIVPISDRYYEIKVKHPLTGEEENLADVGYGHSQILPVLIGGYNCSAGYCFIVEQPEIHLHPKAQTKLASFFVDLKNNRVQSLIETHSEHLVIGVQEFVAAGKLEPSDVALYYVYATQRGKEATLIELDKAGRFMRDWPEGFFPERLEQAKKLSLTRSKRGL